MNDEAIAKFGTEPSRRAYRARPSGIRRGAKTLQRHDRQAAAAYRPLHRRRRCDRGGEVRPRQQAPGRHSRRWPQRPGSRQRQRRPGHRPIDDEGREGRRQAEDGESGPGLHDWRRRSRDAGLRSSRSLRGPLDNWRRGPDAERRSRLPQPPVRPRRRQSARGGRGSGRRQLRHRFRHGERRLALGSARRRRKFRRRDQLPLPNPSGEHGLRGTDRVRTRGCACGDEMVPPVPAERPGGILHVSRAAVGSARRSFSQGALVEEDVRSRRIAQRVPPGGREGRRRGARGPAEADHRLGPADAL